MSDGLYFIIGLIIQPLVVIPLQYWWSTWLHKKEEGMESSEAIKTMKTRLQISERNVSVLSEENANLRKRISEQGPKIIVN